MRTELNLEEVEQQASLDAEVELVAAPNFKTLGPRLGPHAPRVAAWIKGETGRDLSERLANGPVSVEVGQEHLEIRPEDVAFATRVPDGFVLVEDGGIAFLLDARLDEDLQEKGLIRELVHRIQLARKEAGFEVTDRIKVRYEGDRHLEESLAGNREEIGGEVLAVSIEHGVRGDEEYRQDLELDEGHVALGLTRVRRSPRQ